MIIRVEKIHYTPDFKKSYKKLSLRVRKLVDKKDYLFRQDPFHHSLKTHKLHGYTDH